MNGGSISAAAMDIGGHPAIPDISQAAGPGGTGSFTQSSGSVNVSGTMTLWNRSFYRLNGGSLTAQTANLIGSKLILGAGAHVTPRFNALSVTSNGRVDVNDNAMIIDYTGASPASTIRGYIASGRNGPTGLWSGPGITSTLANGTLFGVGYAEASQALGISGSQTATFNGQTVDATTVLVKFTYNGDTDLNGRVNFDDYVRTDNGFNNHLSGWFNGDFDYNGSVNFDDYVLIDFAFNNQNGTLGRATAFLQGSDRSGAGMGDPALQKLMLHVNEFGDPYVNAFLAAVPEPGTALGVAALGALKMVRRRRR